MPETSEAARKIITIESRKLFEAESRLPKKSLWRTEAKPSSERMRARSDATFP